jgi:hypothetical protein
MSLATELMALGMPAGLANPLGLDPPNLAVAAAGTTQATATQLTSDSVVVTTVGASSGVILPNRTGEFFVANGTVTTLTVYPPVGSTFAGGGLTVNQGKAVTNGLTLRAVTAGLTIFATVG